MKKQFPKLFLAILFLFTPTAWAHHTRDHLMLSQDPEQVIAATRAGANGDLTWLIWLGVFVVFVLGLVRWWQSRRAP